MKSYDGCWTCRLRKKRCDETRPECRNCSALQIACHFGVEKPTWMDGGLGQRKKAEEVKSEVKRAAVRRRGTLPADLETAAEGSKDAALDTDRHSSPAQFPSFRGGPPPDSHSGRTPTHVAIDTGPAWRNDRGDPWNGSQSFSISGSPGGQPGHAELDRRFIMFYLDHFFPFMYPFYKPPLLEGGRSWIWELVVGNQAMGHTTLCFSTYFVSVALDGAISGYNTCKVLAWDKLMKQTAVTFVMLQRNLQEVTSSNPPDSIVETSRLMGSIVQLQRFEITVGNFENCRKHLGAAVALFRQLFQATEHTDRCELPTFNEILNRLGRPLWTIKSQHNGSWSTDQAAFRFYSSILIVDDIIASTCLEEPPKLLEYHARLLTNNYSSVEKPPLNLEDFVGCQNWVMLQIGEVAALDAWKKSMKKAGQLDMMELVARAAAIKQALLGNLAHLDAAANAPQTNLLSLFTFYNDQLPPIPGGCAVFVTRVWSLAALLYLSVVVSGWQPGSVGVRENVLRTLALLEQMPAPQLLRTMVWPFCVVGCLAGPEEECRLKAMADALVPHRLFGAARQALKIMENVWRSRQKLTIDTDFAACVCSLGYVSLLV
ncbi:hypothetical protein K491DRAFT_722937 [Lophiostoma macrostomum CBS 122681]|uniref:Zn(2)-C6 fungal-type domain-containing protein n=1 Tax=Lophiostoma macrostomum CBS 122681 TaxID=1314788 RepID=A0A6A6SJG9_9PLEO|nr:hypothetical protein K491DRAFT_722937 [Lophiostoma macrostomum CBS 122681]